MTRITKHIVLISFLFSFCFGVIFGQDSSYFSEDFIKEASSLIELEHTLIRSSMGSMTVMKRYPYLKQNSGAITWNADVSFGTVVAPAYLFVKNQDAYTIFKNVNIIEDGRGESIQAVHCNIAISVTNKFQVAGKFAWLPKYVEIKNNTSTFLVGGEILYKLLKTSSLGMGIDVGGGYSYLNGSHTIPFSNISWIKEMDNGTSEAMSFRGESKSNWQYNVVNTGFKLTKNIYFLRFYAGIDGWYASGYVNSKLLEEKDTVAIVKRNTSEKMYGLVSSGGIEIPIGLLYLNIEVGRDWFHYSLYANAGMKIGN